MRGVQTTREGDNAVACIAGDSDHLAHGGPVRLEAATRDIHQRHGLREFFERARKRHFDVLRRGPGRQRGDQNNFPASRAIRFGNRRCVRRGSIHAKDNRGR